MLALVFAEVEAAGAGVGLNPKVGCFFGGRADTGRPKGLALLLLSFPPAAGVGGLELENENCKFEGWAGVVDVLFFGADGKPKPREPGLDDGAGVEAAAAGVGSLPGGAGADGKPSFGANPLGPAPAPPSEDIEGAVTVIAGISFLSERSLSALSLSCLSLSVFSLSNLSLNAFSFSTRSFSAVSFSALSFSACSFAALSFSLILQNAFASKSCFSHLEYTLLPPVPVTTLFVLSLNDEAWAEGVSNTSSAPPTLLLVGVLGVRGAGDSTSEPGLRPTRTPKVDEAARKGFSWRPRVAVVLPALALFDDGGCWIAWG